MHLPPRVEFLSVLHLVRFFVAQAQQMRNSHGSFEVLQDNVALKTTNESRNTWIHLSEGGDGLTTGGGLSSSFCPLF